uniref:Uncharacterized protein n=1 Tax=Tanacetum cinerariifolium TaxID=118510 RepID=A0A6L2K0Z0_TANCI|nr:hypothetical protein [Tanacetum cinerariifolium]
MEITAIIDGRVKVVTKASVRRHLKLEDSDGAPSTSPPYLSSPPRSSIRQKTKVPQPSSPTHTHVADEAASTGVDVKHEGLPLLKVLALETDLKQTKKVYGDAHTKLIMKVKKLEKNVKTSQARRKAKIVVSDEETFRGAIITASVNISPASPTRSVSTDDDITMAETLVYIRRSATKRKDKVKGIMEESESTMTKTKRQQEILGHEVAVRLQEEFDEEERARVKADEELTQRLQVEERNKYSEVDQEKMLKLEVQKEMQRKSLIKERSKKQKIRESSEPRNKDVDEPSQEELHQLMIIVPEQGMHVEALQTKYPIIDWEIYTEDTRKYWKIIRVGNHTEAYQFFDDMIKVFDRDDLVQLWSLVKERFSLTEPTDDKERGDCMIHVKYTMYLQQKEWISTCWLKKNIHCLETLSRLEAKGLMLPPNLEVLDVTSPEYGDGSSEVICDLLTVSEMEDPLLDESCEIDELSDDNSVENGDLDDSLLDEGKENEDLLLDSINEGPFQFKMIDVTATENSVAERRLQTLADLISEENLKKSCDIKALNFILIAKQGKNPHEVNFDQFYAFLKQNKNDVNEVRVMHQRFPDPLAFLAHTYNPPPSYNIQNSQYNQPPSFSNQSQYNPSSSYSSHQLQFNPTPSYNIQHFYQSQQSYDVPKYWYQFKISTNQQPTKDFLKYKNSSYYSRQQSYSSECSRKTISGLCGSVNGDDVTPTYDSDILFEVPHYDTYHDNDMLNFVAQETEYSEHLVTNNDSYYELTSDNNVISYAAYMVTLENDAVQSVPPLAQDNAMILSVIEQMKTQVDNCNIVNQENKSVNESLSNELKGYKDKVKVLEERLKSTNFLTE